MDNAAFRKEILSRLDRLESTLTQLVSMLMRHCEEEQRQALSTTITSLPSLSSLSSLAVPVPPQDPPTILKPPAMPNVCEEVQRALDEEQREWEARKQSAKKR